MGQVGMPTSNVKNHGKKARKSDSEECIICTDLIEYSALAPCNNVTCHRCCLRQRALYKKNTCMVCRTDHDDIIICDRILDDAARFTDFVAPSIPFASEEYGLHFTTEKVRNETLALLEFKCTHCSSEFSRFGQLNDHVRSAHGGRQYCDICASHQRAFICELKLYIQKELEKHVNEGDKKGFKGHPRCRFCRNKRFYSDDELMIHIRDHHERCYLCDQDNYVLNAYYRNYDDLYGHFRSQHYVCLVPLCVEKRFVVFREELDLTAHMLKEHGGIMSKNGRVVVGSALLLFQLHLSTLPQAPTVDLETQRRRLDERAKHYLGGNEASITTYRKGYSSYKARKLSAQEVVTLFMSLFKDTEYLDLALLIHEMVQIFPSHSDLGVQLQNAFDAVRPSSVPVAPHFPVLGNSGSRTHVLINLLWGGNLRVMSQEELFPALAKPVRSKPPAVLDLTRYSTVSKKPVVINTTKPLMSIKNFEPKNKTFKPTYLEKPVKTTAPTPFLGLGTSSRSTSQVLSRSQSPSTPSSGHLPQLSDSQFPALVKKKRTTIPPVKPMPSPSTTWSTGLAASAQQPKEEWGLPIIDKKAKKLRLKKERAKKK